MYRQVIRSTRYFQVKPMSPCCTVTGFQLGYLESPLLEVISDRPVEPFVRSIIISCARCCKRAVKSVHAARRARVHWGWPVLLFVVWTIGISYSIVQNNVGVQFADRS